MQKTTIPEARAIYNTGADAPSLTDAVESIREKIDRLREVSEQEGAKTGYANAADTIAELRLLLRESEQRHAAELAREREVREKWREAAENWERRAKTSEATVRAVEAIRQLAEGPSPCPICGFWPYECKCKTAPWDRSWVDRAGRLHEPSGQRDSFSFREYL